MGRNVYKSGLLIYRKKFKKTPIEIDDLLVSGELAKIKAFLDASIQKSGETIIEKRDKTVIIIPGQFLVGIMICDWKSSVLLPLFSKFVSFIENLYEYFLKKWNHDLKIFQPIDEIVSEYFLIDT